MKIRKNILCKLKNSSKRKINPFMYILWVKITFEAWKNYNANLQLNKIMKSFFKNKNKLKNRHSCCKLN